MEIPRKWRKRGLLTIAFLGYDGGEIARKKLADFAAIDAGAECRTHHVDAHLEHEVSSGHAAFQIYETDRTAEPTVPISPDLTLCAEFLHEMRDPSDPRYAYPYINCTRT